MNQAEEAAAVTGGPAIDKLQQRKLSLTEKLAKLQSLDEEILALVEDSAIDEEIEQADIFCEKLQQTVCDIERLICSKSSSTVTHTKTAPESTSKASEKSGATDVPHSTTSPTSGSKVKLPS